MVQFDNAVWGVFFAALLYVLGNGVWVNHLVRERTWLGWVLWSVLGGTLLLVVALFESRLDQASGMGAMERLGSVAPENHWIAIGLFALMSVPGAASVLMKQSIRWTRITLLLPAILLFIPVGRQLANPDDNYLLLSLGSTLAICAVLYIWQLLLDSEPQGHVKSHAASEGEG
ncbi:MAG TPA: hypothetical protein VKA94_06610 [Hyphomicrobiales bacterium]|nr:hypothetical protein [Hyphomicrobiales bacterium]